MTTPDASIGSPPGCPGPLRAKDFLWASPRRPSKGSPSLATTKIRLLFSWVRVSPGPPGFPFRSASHGRFLAPCAQRSPSYPGFPLRWHRGPQPDLPRFPDVTLGADEARNVRCARVPIVLDFRGCRTAPRTVRRARGSIPSPTRDPCSAPVLSWDCAQGASRAAGV